MSKIFAVIILSATLVAFQFCSSTKKASKAASLTYESNIKPILVGSCGPCHVEGKGNKKALDNYANASHEIEDIITRIQKNPGERGFMPVRHSKLSDSTINLFVEWKNTGLTEK